MEMEKKITEMFKKSANDLDRLAAWAAKLGSEERDAFERVYGERQAYSRILVEMFGMTQSELQKILNDVHRKSGQ